MDFIHDAIAVVGIGCHFPGGEGIDNFWKVLLEGRNCTVQIPSERFDSTYWYDPDDSKPGKSRTSQAALIDGLNTFDHKFFGISELEANCMDPQQKLLLECSYRALENAGIPMEKASGTCTGVFIGLMNRDYEHGFFGNSDVVDHYSSTGTAMSIAANRISYTFNLTGPSFAIDCACSSSLVALHSACQALRHGDCEMALCGGVSCIIEPRTFVALSKAKMISPEGTSKPFSSRADGYGRGEGCGIILLKPLNKALKDFDHIWGIINRTTVNQDGRTATPITKPSVIQQEELLRRAYCTEADALHVQYMEAHGTGTPVGDPIEAGSISKIIAKNRTEELFIGSVKGNIGHTESAAGVAGVIKVLLMMHHKTIVPSVFYSDESSSIDAKSLNLKIPTRPLKWEKSDTLGRIAGVNNFGFGGTNAHVILKQYKPAPVPKRVIHESKPMLLVVSAASEKSLAMALTDTANMLSTDKTVDLPNLAYTAACRRSHAKHRYRTVFMASSLTGLQTQLRSALGKKVTPSKAGLTLIFVFCGNGVTYRGMCQQLLREEPVFRDKVKEVEKVLQKYKNINLVQLLESDSDSGDYSNKPDVVQPLLFTVQCAIAALLRHWGVRADVVLGHSVGEVAAAYCSGLLCLEDAVKVVYFRSTLQSQVSGGKMLVVSNVAVAEIVKHLPAYSGKVGVAAFNSPQSCTLSGEADAIESLRQELKTSLGAANLFLQILDVPVAYHSHMMDPILSKIEDNIGTMQKNEMESELFSTVTGQSVTQGDFNTGQYWAKNIREPVAFEQTLKSATEGKRQCVLVEISPKRALQRNIVETLGSDTTVLSSVQPDKDQEALLTLLSKLFELGVQVNWEQFYKGYEAPPTSFPRYQFDGVKKDLNMRGSNQPNELTSSFEHPVLGKANGEGEFSCSLNANKLSFLSEHKNRGVVIIPGAFYVELGFASFIAHVGSKIPLSSVQLEITFQNPFLLGKNSPEMTVKVQPTDKGATFQVHSPVATYASGSIHRSEEISADEVSLSLDSIFRRCNTVYTSEQIYRNLYEVGFQYSSVFRQLRDVHYGNDFKEAVSGVQVPEELHGQLYDYCVHPVVLDYFIQLSAVVAGNGFQSKFGFPVSIGSLTILGPLQKEMVMYLRETSVGSDFFEVCGCFTNKNGNVLIELKHVRIKFLGGTANSFEELLFQSQLIAVQESPCTNEKPKALVFADAVGVAKALRENLHPESIFIPYSDLKKSFDIDSLFLKHRNPIPGRDYTEMLFLWGVQNLSTLKQEDILEPLVNLCDVYKQIVLKLRAMNFSGPLRTVTYRPADEGDHLRASFVLPGMSRSCAAEMPGRSFQLIDISSVSSQDIRALSNVIQMYPGDKYPDIVINTGQIYASVVMQSPTAYHTNREQTVERFILQTRDAYRVACLTASSCEKERSPEKKAVEVQLERVCVHSSDYFPVSISDANFGQTIYWNKCASQNHALLALDFSGIVTAVGSGVSKLRVGDRVVSCYPVAASSNVMVPEAACYSAKKVPFLKEAPCMSYFVLAWHILNHNLPKEKHAKKMGIISSDLTSCLLQVLTITAGRCGWNAVAGAECSGLLEDVNKCEAFVFLPPFDPAVVTKACSVSTVKHIVVVQQNQHVRLCPPRSFKAQNAEVHIQTLETDKIFQKANLKQQKRSIVKWLQSMDLKPKSIELQSVTFQKTISDRWPDDTDCNSYFCCKTMPVIVLNKDEKNKRSNIPVLEKPKQLFQKKAVFIVTGGLSGLGFETVKFIAEKGGSSIVTLSRSAPSLQIQNDIQNIQNQHGVQIRSLQCDISIFKQVVKAVRDIEQIFPSCQIRGVFHSAVVLHDGYIETLDKPQIQKVLKPKINGALNLHYATKHCKLDYFVCYSSISSYIGSSAQTSYAAANSFLDQFCYYRRSLGLAGQSINWGALNLGLLLNNDHLQKLLESKGLVSMNIPEILEGLEQSLLLNNPLQVVCRFNFRALNSYFISQNSQQRIRFLTLLTEESRKNHMTETTEQYKTSKASADEYIRVLLSETCNTEISELSEDTSLFALGIDSMLAMTLQNQIFRDREVLVPLVKLLDPNSTLSTLVLMLNNGGETNVQQIDYQENHYSIL